MERARERGNHFADAGADFADTRDRLERLGLFFDGNSGTAAFRLPEEKDEGRKLEFRNADCGKRKESKEQLISDAESVFQRAPNTIHFFGSQGSKPSLEFNRRNGLDLLQMKRAGF